VNGNTAAAALQQNHGPIAIVGLGVVASVLGKYLKG
jgi:phage tail tape-measure protein